MPQARTARRRQKPAIGHRIEPHSTAFNRIEMIRMNTAMRFSTRLLRWYDRHRRDLPWRAAPGEGADPYQVWLSEVMLQQTTVAAVGPYFGNFLAKWPTVGALASAAQDEVMTAWAGLGYYSRARNLHKCAQIVAFEHGALFPQTEHELLKLPGIGPYTAAAIAAIAFGRRANVVDGNVERVIARIFNLREPLPGVKPALKEAAAGLVPESRCGDYAQALMDLGATICTPKSPKCMICPVAEECAGRRAGDPDALPVRAPKAAKPVRYGTAFLLARGARFDRAVYLRKRPDTGLLGGMLEVPSTPWREQPWTDDDEAVLAHAPSRAKWQPVAGEVEHTFTHFHLRLRVLTAITKTRSLEGVWAPADRLQDYALPTVMKKIVRLAMGKS